MEIGGEDCKAAVLFEDKKALTDGWTGADGGCECSNRPEAWVIDIIYLVDNNTISIRKR